MLDMGLVRSLIRKYAPGVSPETIVQAVDDYLDAHPEATTTVQDGSITEAKLAQDVTAILSGLEDDTASLLEAIENIEDDLSEYDEAEAVAAPMGWRLNADDGLCSSDDDYQMKKFLVTAGQVVKVVSDDRFQFQTVASVPSYGTSNRVGQTYGAGTFVLTVPETATYLIVSTTIAGSTAKAYDRADRLNGMETRLATVEDDTVELNTIINGVEYKIEPTNINGLNFVSGATAYTTASYYYTKYIPVLAFQKYHFTFQKVSGSPSLRIVFSESLPANGVSGVEIGERSVSLTGSYSFDYIPSKDGYIGVAAWYETTEQYTVSVKGIKSAEKPNGRTFLKMYCENESLTQDTGTVSMDSWTTVPYNSAKVWINCPDNIVVWFTYLKSPYSESTKTSAYYGNGDVIVLEKDYDLYKVHFAYGSKSNGTYTLSAETLHVYDVAEMIFSEKIQLLYEEEPTIVNNKDTEKNVWAIIGDGTNPVFSHISDVHGDAVRYMNFMELSRYFKVLVAFNTGDIVNEFRSDGFGYVKTAIRQYPDVDTVFCIGNHDAPGTNALSYQLYYKMFNEAYGYGLSQNGTYYYKDYENDNLRIIVLNIYEEKHNGYDCCISQEQIEWFIGTLKATPAGYGVIVVAHCPEKWVPKDETYGKFWTKGATSTWGNTYSGITGNPVSTIIDAFISKASITGSYSQEILTTAGGSTTETVTVSYEADFTNVATGAEFICYINGHKHCDLVGYLDNTTNPQLNLNIANGVASHYYRSENDLPRADGKGNVQDTINLYVIDRSNKSVKIARIGASVTKDMAVRDYMIIPYAE